MATILFDDYRTDSGFTPNRRELRIVRVDGPGPRLDAAYELLQRVFDPAVVDSKATYIELLSPGGLRLDGFLVICVAAVFDDSGAELLAGFLSSNLMWIDREHTLLQLAIGNIVTSPKLKEMNFRGAGTALLNSAFEIATAIARTANAELAYSVAEAQSESLGFWRKAGFLRPDGLEYLQPPLEFNFNGEPVHQEVPETFMVRPMGQRRRETIETAVLRQMILAIYRNWCIEPQRDRLSESAFCAASDYVLQYVFPRVLESIPINDKVQIC